MEIVNLDSYGCFFIVKKESEVNNMKMTNKTYDILVWIAQIVLPALGAFYATIASIWGLPFEVEIPATILAVDTLLGAVLKISNSKYKNDIDKE